MDRALSSHDAVPRQYPAVKPAARVRSMGARCSDCELGADVAPFVFTRVEATWSPGRRRPVRPRRRSSARSCTWLPLGVPARLNVSYPEVSWLDARGRAEGPLRTPKRRAGEAVADLAGSGLT